MLRPAAGALPICPMCQEPGIHPTDEGCIKALRAAVDHLRTQIAHLPKDSAVEHLGRWVPSFYP